LLIQDAASIRNARSWSRSSGTAVVILTGGRSRFGRTGRQCRRSSDSGLPETS
jgi:hypothetical protein